MAMLGLKPGPVVGRAYKFLLEERMENGPLEPADAEDRLRAWWAKQPESAHEELQSPATGPATPATAVEPSQSEES
jgi:poly(A) polymerase